MANWIVSFLLVLAVFLSSSSAKGGGKYSKEKNSIKDETVIRQSSSENEPPKRKAPEHFRVARLDAIWERAQRHLNVDDQRDIFEELKDLDEDEITLKRLRHEGGDKNGEITEKLRDRLHDLLEKFDLLTPLHDKSGTPGTKPQNAEKSRKGPKTEPAPIEHLFTDKKLNKLWAKAKKAGFSKQELANLKAEFDHHQDKLDNYREPESNIPPDVTDFNRFHGLADELTHEERQDPSSGTLDGKHQQPDVVQLDAGVKDIVKNYGRLKAKVTKNAYVLDNGDFSESRVEELWKQALAAGFNRDELLSLREELGHFERKLSKLKNFREGNVLGKSKADSQAKAGEKSEDHIDLEQKVKHYSVKLDNMHADIERRINTRHNEL